MCKAKKKMPTENMLQIKFNVVRYKKEKKNEKY